jgi:hypothetical protein
VLLENRHYFFHAKCKTEDSPKTFFKGVIAYALLMWQDVYVAVGWPMHVRE